MPRPSKNSSNKIKQLNEELKSLRNNAKKIKEKKKQEQREEDEKKEQREKNLKALFETLKIKGKDKKENFIQLFDKKKVAHKLPKNTDKLEKTIKEDKAKSKPANGFIIFKKFVTQEVKAFCDENFISHVNSILIGNYASKRWNLISSKEKIEFSKLALKKKIALSLKNLPNGEQVIHTDDLSSEKKNKKNNQERNSQMRISNLLNEEDTQLPIVFFESTDYIKAKKKGVKSIPDANTNNKNKTCDPASEKNSRKRKNLSLDNKLLFQKKQKLNNYSGNGSNEQPIIISDDEEPSIPEI